MNIKPKLLTVIGTRPEAIKMCPLITAINKSPFFEGKLCVSGQHKEMLDTALSDFSVTPDFDLEIMKRCSTPSEMTSVILERLTPIMEYQAPDGVLVHGDTTTALSAALASFYLGIPVFHVEAGLRSFDVSSPFPEEFNRVTIDSLSSLLFAPTRQAEKNLLSEGKSKERIFVTGNTVIDALLMSLKKDFPHPLLRSLLPRKECRFAILTLHRRESIGEPMKNILRGVRRVIEENADISLLFPMHKNPAVRSVILSELEGCDRIFLTDPIDTVTFHNMLARCDIVLTDSGGIQEEAAFLGKPTLVAREVTERADSMGNPLCIGRSEEAVYRHFSTLLTNSRILERMSRPSDAYGKGDASEKILSILYRHFFG